MPRHPWIEFPLIILGILGPVLVVALRLTLKKKITHKDGRVEERQWGIGVRVIQLVAVLILVPAVAILALEGALTGEATGTLMGAIVGYALGGITAPVPE